MAEMQQRLVRAQIEMEKDYRKLRDIESRYRILFHLAVEPLIVVEAQTLKIVDANDGAAKLLDRPVKKLVGTSRGARLQQGRPGRRRRAADRAWRARPCRRVPRPAGDAWTGRCRSASRRSASSAAPISSSAFASEDQELPGASTASDATLVSMVDSLPEGIVIVNGEGNIVEANPAFLDLIRVVSLDRVEDKGLDNWLGGSSVDLQVLMANLREHGTVRRFSSVVRDELGGSEMVEVSAARIASRDGPLFGFAIREAVAQRDLARRRTLPVPAVSTQFTELVGRVPLKDLVRDTADIIEKLCIEAALRLTDNNRASAADMLGLSRQSLYIKLKRYGMSETEEPEA